MFSTVPLGAPGCPGEVGAPRGPPEGWTVALTAGSIPGGRPPCVSRREGESRTRKGHNQGL